MGNMLKPSRGIEFQKSTEVRSIAESEQQAEKRGHKGRKQSQFGTPTFMPQVLITVETMLSLVAYG